MSFLLFGCRVKIEFSFILMLCFAIVLGADSIAYLLLFSAFHELGHFAVLLAFGGKAESLTFSFYGLALKYETKLGRFAETLVILAGPLVNLILYLILRDDINLLLFFVNMLPVYPIDFGRVVKLYFPAFSKVISIVFLVFLSIFSVYLIIVYKSFSLIFITCYLIIYSVLY